MYSWFIIIEKLSKQKYDIRSVNAFTSGFFGHPLIIGFKAFVLAKPRNKTLLSA